MKYYTRLVLSLIIAFLLGGLMIFWGLSNDGIVRIIVGLLIVLGMTLNAIHGIKNIIELKSWIAQNESRLILFYPCKKRIQDEIESTVLPLLPENCLKVYYKGPAISGDIKQSVTIELMNQYKEINVNSPSIFKFKENKIHLERLAEFKNIKADTIDQAAIKIRIDKIINT